MFRPENKIVVENGNDTIFTTYVAMEDLLDKLMLLHYEPEFVKNLKMKPLNRHYFVVQRNPGEQFFMFTSLSAWLIKKLGRSFDEPQEYDDPNATIASILEVIREIGVVVDFPPNKLKQGFGEQVIYVLNQLANAVLQKNNFLWNKPEIVSEQEPEPEIAEDDSELILDRVEEEMAAGSYSEPSDDEAMFRIDDVSKLSNKKDKNQEIVLSNVDSESWRLELERILPQLKVTVRTDGREWRAHLEQMKNHRAGIEEALTTTQSQLDKLQTDISMNLEKIQNREKYMNSHLEPILEQYRQLKDEVSKINDHYKSVSGGVTERTRELTQLTDQLDTVKQQMEERGASMTDGTPLINIKKAVSNIKSEIKEMDIRIGVLQSIYLQSKIRDKRLLDQNLSSPHSNINSYVNLVM
ncbi:intraflagellar transport protein 57 homolog [Chrysoperla carnea]|uniref:intraflagellar transport protein 57 homolog n=1 Tax=Chrysoperla carnea TaxID=189513 RepID=UPI001D071596|nr:intraflagellar transport protein 57 homolog [Chrysoperla carnea]